MDHLSKQQLVLLALLVSFVTSLATGIFTVSLMNQAPQGVIQTINHVVEKTVQTASSQNASVGTVSVTIDDQIADAVTKVGSSLVSLVSRDSSKTVAGFGLIVSKQGVIIADKNSLSSLNGYAVLLADGTKVPVSVIQSQVDGDIVFLAPDGSMSTSLISFTPISFAKSPRLGQTVLSFKGTSTPKLMQGIITSSAPSVVETSVAGESSTVGGPLFDPSGAVIGIKTSSLNATNSSMFYPVSNIKAVVPVVQ